MREFESTFRDGLKKGLRKHHDNPRNVEGVVKCLNTKPSEGGLIPIVPVTYSIDSAVSWPFPQLFNVSIPDLPYTLSLVDSLEFDEDRYEEGTICHVSGDIYAIAYRSANEKGKIATADISSVGVIANAVVHSGTFSADAYYPAIKKVGGSTTYAIAHRDSDNYGNIETVTITDAGTISATGVGNWVFNSNTTTRPRLYELSNNYFAVVYTDSSDDGWIKTFKVDDDGTIGSEIDSLEFDNDQGKHPMMARVYGDVYIIVYSGPGDDGWACTVEIDSVGNIGSAVIDTLEFDVADCEYPDIANIGGHLFLVSYRGVDNDGYLATFMVTDEGKLGDVLDTFEFDTTGVYGLPSAVPMSRVGFAVVGYSQALGSPGYLKTFNVDGAGVITSNAALHTLEFDSDTQRGNTDMIALGGDYFAIIYGGPGIDGWLRTFKVA